VRGFFVEKFSCWRQQFVSGNAYMLTATKFLRRRHFDGNEILAAAPLWQLHRPGGYALFLASP